MNLSLTMQFDSLEELQSFLNRNPAARAAPVVSIAPDVVEQAATAVLVDIADVVPAVVDDEAADYDDARAELMGKLKELAGSMDDPTQLGAFINKFGVQRFSDLPDEKLVEFESALLKEYKV